MCWGFGFCTLPFGSVAVSYRIHMDQGLWTCCFSTGFNFQLCLRPSAALTNHSQTQPAEERARLVYAFTSQCVMKDVRVGALSRILEAGAEAEAMEKGSLLACSVCFLCTLGPPAQRQHHPQWTGPFHIIHQWEKCATDLPQTNLMNTSCQLMSAEVPLLR